MQLRKLGILVGFMGIFYSGFVSALGLGEIALKSSYNEPLKAEIRLLQVRDLSKEQILVSLASREDFKRVGVDRFFFLTDLKFDVVLKGNAQYIVVTSNKPIQEPYLNFLVEAQWPSGRLLREYTLLFDLPVFGGQANTQVTAPSRSAPPVRSTRATSAPTYSKPQAQTFASSGDYRVRAGDTLWEVAAKMRPSSAVTVQQTMIAIQDANPDAFINGNINLLRKGQVLRAPDASEIEANSHNEAVAAIRQQHQSWSKKPKKAPLSAAPSSTNSSASSSSQGRLTLGSADSSDAANAVKGSGSSGSGESLQNELAIAQEELDKATRENSDLKARVAELEAQFDTMESLVKLKSDQLKALELAAQQDDTTTQVIDANVEPAINDSPVSDVVTDTVGDTPVTDTQTAVDLPDPALVTPEPVEPVVVPEPTVVEPEPVVEPAPVDPIVPETDRGIVGLIMDNIVYIGGALLALLLGLFAFKRMRANSADEDGFSEYEFDEDAPHLDDEGDPIDAIEEEMAESQNLAATELDDLEDDVEAKTEDAVAEADIYLSLGQDDKAEGLLQKEIQQNPDNADARLALLKMYAKSQNPSSFDDQYAQLLPLGNINANNQAKALRETISGITDFDTDSYSLDDTAMDLGEDDGLSLDDSLDVDSDGLLGEGQSEDTGELDLDLDLDFDNDVDFLSDEPNTSIDAGELDLNEEANLLGDSDGSLNDELDIDLDLDLDDIDLNTDLAGDLSGDVDEGFNLDLGEDESLNNDLLALDEKDNNEANLDLGLEDDFIADLDLNGGELDVAGSVEFSLDDVASDTATALDDLDIDLPADDLDIDSLDKEIDEMTAALDGPEDNLAESVFGGTDDAEASLDSGLAAIDTSMADIDDALDSGLEGVEEVTDYGLDDLLSDSDATDDLGSLEMDSLGDTVSADLGLGDDILDLDSASLDDELAALDDSVPTVETDINSIDDLQENLAVEDDDFGLDESTEVVDDLDFLAEDDEVTTKLELAKAYIDMGDREGAQDILDEVLEEGNQEQQVQAKSMLESL